MKPVHGFAVVDNNGDMDIWSAQMPIYWMKRDAKKAIIHRPSYKGENIVKVKIMVKGKRK